MLEQHLPVPFEPAVVDQRTVIKRQTAYLSNASQTDRLRLQVTVAVQDPATPQEPIRLWLNYVMWRCSDDRKMMVSTVRKLVTGMTWGDTLMFERLKAWKQR